MNKPTASVQTEIDAAYLYTQLATVEDNETIASIYKQMAAIERSHADCADCR